MIVSYWEYWEFTELETKCFHEKTEDLDEFPYIFRI